MAEGFVNVTEGSGKKLHTWDRTIGANTVHDEFTQAGEFPYATYVVPILTAGSAANDHLLSIQAGASLNLRLRSIVIRQAGNAAAAGVLILELRRLSAVAHSGGTAITPSPLDAADAASGFTARSIPTTKGTEGVLVGTKALVVRQAILTTASQQDGWADWQFDNPRQKALTVAAGSSNGIAIKTLNATTATFTIEAIVSEQNFL